MKIRITAGGIFGATGELPIGMEFSITGPLPEGWVGRCIVLTDTDAPLTADTSAPLTADTAPVMPLPISPATMEKPELLEWLVARGWDGDRRLGVDKLREAALALSGA